MLGRSPSNSTALTKASDLPGPRLVKNGIVLASQPKPSYLARVVNVDHPPPGAEAVPMLAGDIDDVLRRIFGSDTRLYHRLSCNDEDGSECDFQSVLAESGVHSNEPLAERFSDTMRRVRFES
ncbi:MAG: hypothetical protein HYV13_02870 [Candidatus Doudnabacteria bacterium]|nr:hypothetical protein [Candidatus Doudnabacteria bacterium]